ncbi:hypothetical protein [Altererythrobacter sp. ZODW24]|uniref:hypothetical protein n=1 Tax=Altererythrobacter sp. ZODW24 TaxID=2185142 RepID=UPI000DF75137|nr:hypothetical protein [Altererythrobacter sp. ZODW24]
MLQTIFEHRVEAQAIFMVLLVLCALWRGSGPERAVALTMAGMKVAAEAYLAITEAKISLLDMDVAMATIDLVVCVVLVFVGLQANRMYTLWIAAFQIIALNAHIVREIATGISPLAYAIMYIAPSYFQLFILAGGIWCHARRERLFGPYRSWRRPPAGASLA